MPYFRAIIVSIIAYSSAEIMPSAIIIRARVIAL